jgi:dTDP-4-dehydrorhamnose 3,5-epimerase
MTNPILIEVKKHNDNRGGFYESYNKAFLKQNYGIDTEFIQDNHSISKKNVVRGLHYQWNKPIDKLVRVSYGRVLDICVDIRANSNKYGEVYYNILDDENLKQLYVPAGFAHGFVALTDTAHLLYKYNNYYNKDGESGINPFDLSLEIYWGLKQEDAIISKRDLDLQTFLEYEKDPKF